MERHQIEVMLIKEAFANLAEKASKYLYQDEENEVLDLVGDVCLGSNLTRDDFDFDEVAECEAAMDDFLTSQVGGDHGI